MPVIIEDDILKKAEMTSDQLLVELAAFLYDKEILSFGKARALTNLDIISFQKELASKNINIKYDIQDLELDMKNLEEFRTKKAS